MAIVGGAIYAALILHTAVNAKVEVVTNLNKKAFQRVHPNLADNTSSEAWHLILCRLCLLGRK